MKNCCKEMVIMLHFTLRHNCNRDGDDEDVKNRKLTIIGIILGNCYL